MEHKRKLFIKGYQVKLRDEFWKVTVSDVEIPKINKIVPQKVMYVDPNIFKLRLKRKTGGIVANPEIKHI